MKSKIRGITECDDAQKIMKKIWSYPSSGHSHPTNTRRFIVAKRLHFDKIIS
jgi:hypothetical protein